MAQDKLIIEFPASYLESCTGSFNLSKMSAATVVVKSHLHDLSMESPFERYHEIIPDYTRFVDALHQPLPIHLRVNLLKIEPCPLIQRLKQRVYR
jgi:16S rRNA C967 or C1407 C5-methylase (RsmB/RsmF family)